MKDDLCITWHQTSLQISIFKKIYYLRVMEFFFSTSVHFSCSVVSDSSRPHELQHARPPCPSPTPGVHPNSCPLSRWCHPTVSSSVVPFSSHPQSFPALESFQMSQFFTSGGQNIGEMTHLKRPWCLERLRVGGEGDKRGWDGWMASRTHGRESEWTPGDGDGQGGLECCSSWGRKESDMTERLN